MDLTKKKYQASLRQSFVENSEKPYTILIQQYNNNIVDKKINSIVNDTEYEPNWFNIQSTLFNYNYQQTLKKYQRLIKSPYVDTNELNNVLFKNKAFNLADDMAKMQVERISKNLDYVEKAISNAKIDIQNYNKMAKRFPNVDRVNILSKAVDSGKLWNGKELNYSQLDKLSKSLNKYAENKTELEKWNLANQQALQKGLEEIKPYKIWFWSQLENTRHSGMDETVISINKHFIVVNEVTGDIDNLMFPQDVNNDTNNCSNICNCDCTYEFLTKEEAEAYL